MKKWILIISAVIIFIMLSSFLLRTYVENKKKEISWEKKQEIITKDDDEILKKESATDTKNKILALRKRYAVKWLVSEWDKYLENDQLTLALKTYLEALKNNSDDNDLIQKIGDTYFKMKKFKIANSYYKNILDYEELNKENLVYSYLYTKTRTDFTSSWYLDMKDELSTYNINKDDFFVHLTTVSCAVNLKTCKENFKKYLKVNPTTQNPQLIKVKDSFNAFVNLKVEQSYYEDALLIWAIFENWNYPVSVVLSENLLKSKKWYLPMLKILAKSNFELWNYTLAKKNLGDYYDIDKNEPNILYMLWVTNMRLHEYILSNIYFIKALDKKFAPIEDVYRNLIYNYYVLEDTSKMLEYLKRLISTRQNPDPKDLSLAIYYYLINWKEIEALKWIKKWLDLYPKYDDFYWYKWWILKEKKDFDNAEKAFNIWYSLNKHNPLINLNLWIIAWEKWDYLKAKLYLKNTISEDPKWQFWEQAAIELDKITAEEQKRKESIELDISTNVN